MKGASYITSRWKGDKFGYYADYLDYRNADCHLRRQHVQIKGLKYFCFCYSSSVEEATIPTQIKMVQKEPKENPE